MYSQRKRHSGAATRTRRRNYCFGARLGAAIAWLALAAAVSAPATGTAAVALVSNTELATAGFYRLSWEAESHSGTDFELQEATSPTFADARTLYHGPDLATVLSGRADGQYYYRVRASSAGATGQWSESVQVDVEHHSLARAFGFFAAGAIVFLATLGLIVFGSKQSRGGPR